ncbi:MAG: hypothetical protein AB8G05_16510 [Oligoflexales bacterium]
MSLRTKIKKKQDVSQKDHKDMFYIFQKYYDCISFDKFVRDLQNKTHVIFLFDHLKLIGFSTAHLGQSPKYKGTVIFSGDTVVERKYWGQKILQKAFYQLLFKAIIKSPFRPVYWMLMSKGYKTYLLMRKNFPRSYPNFYESTPYQLEEIKNCFYKDHYGIFFQKNQSIIAFDSSKGQLKQGIAQASEADCLNPEINFFTAKNPKASLGEELACIAHIRWYDLFYTGIKHCRHWFKLNNPGKQTNASISRFPTRGRA